MKSARINFGIPDSEYILEVDDSGAATSLVNQDTNTEYVGGESGLMAATYLPEHSRINLNKSFNEVVAIMALGVVPYIVIDNSISGYIGIPVGTIIPFVVFNESEGIHGAAFYDGTYHDVIFEISGGLDGTLFYYVD